MTHRSTAPEQEAYEQREAHALALAAADRSAIRALVATVEIVDEIDDYAVVGGIRREPNCLICGVEGPALDWPPHHHECVVLRVRQQFGIVGPLRDDYPPAPAGALLARIVLI
jgi:hypothetical protein